MNTATAPPTPSHGSPIASPNSSLIANAVILPPQPLFSLNSHAMQNQASSLLQLLICPQCNPPAPLSLPTTLRCGHTICSRHVVLDPPLRSKSTRPSAAPPQRPLVPSCPLPTCHPRPRISTPVQSTRPPSPSIKDPPTNRPPPSPSTSSSASSAMHPNIPSTSRVVFHPAKLTPDSPLTRSIIKVHHAQHDVMLTKISTVLHRYADPDPQEAHAPQLDEHDDPDSASEVDADADANADADSGIAGMNRAGDRDRDGGRSTPSSPDSTHRPPKRMRRTSPNADGSPETSDSDTLSKELFQELTCEICYMLLQQPVTTPCQHTFCAKCLQRSLDHSDKCPLCRQDLSGYSYFHDHPVNKVVLSLLLQAFPDVYQERKEQIEAEDRDVRLDTPIFVCQLSFPSMPTLLHFFEPRYRLMLRRCLEQTVPCFGMVMPPQPGGATDYGTMLEIRSVQMLPDGRSMVETWGTYRFRIVERGTFDGYMVGRIERIDDCEGEVEEEVVRSGGIGRGVEPTEEEMVSVCHTFVNQLRNGMAPWVVQRLNHTYGPMPTDVSNFTFWMGLILPIDEHEKAKLLPIRSARLRLRLLVHWIEQLNGQWWFMNGCTVA